MNPTRKSVQAFLIAFSLLLAGCAQEAAPPDSAAPPSSSDAAPPGDTARSDTALVARAERVVEALREKSWTTLAAMVHPERGVLFSPYGFVDTARSVVLMPAQIAALGRDEAIRRWGTKAGSGTPIRLSFDAYYDAFIYDEEFAEAQRGAPGEILKRGTTKINLSEAFPDARFIAYHVPGREEEYGGLDWSSLRLVFALYRGMWKLVGIVHDEWTP